MNFEHVAFVFYTDSPTFVLERLLSCVNTCIALIVKRVFFKTLSGSIYTSFMIRSSGQGVLKFKKITNPKYVCVNVPLFLENSITTMCNLFMNIIKFPYTSMFFHIKLMSELWLNKVCCVGLNLKAPKKAEDKI